MISISEKIYQDLAELLINQLNHSSVFNSSLEIDYPELYSTLHCTLLIYHQQQCDKHEKTSQIITDIVPVWWEFETASAYGFEHNDFSWCEFYEYLKAYFH